MSETKTNQARVEINEANLLQTLRHAFSGSTTFVGELMQNARRAGATEIRFSVESIDIEAEQATRLIIEDNGRGVGNVGALLCVAESDWGREIDCETPYGVGFLSALYAARRVRVESSGFMFESDTEALLRGEPVELESISDAGTTRVELRGISTGDMDPRASHDLLTRQIHRQARGFPVRVFLNDTELQREHAIDIGGFHSDDSVGQIRIPGIHAATEPALQARRIAGSARYAPIVYLNGQPVGVGRIRSYGGGQADGSTIVHLDPERFRARWPDRDTLYDENVAEKAIRDLVRSEVHRFLVGEKAAYRAGQRPGGREGDPGELDFVGRYLELFDYAPELFTAAARIHGDLLDKPDYPVIPHDDAWEGGSQFDVASNMPDGITQDDVESGAIVLVDASGGFDPEEQALTPMAAFAGGGVYAVTRPEMLPTWAQAKVLQDSQLRVRVLGAERDAVVYDSRALPGDPLVLFCERYEIETTDGRTIAELDSYSVYLNYDPEVMEAIVVGEDLPELLEQLVVIPSGDRSAEVLRQIDTFEDENDDYQEALHGIEQDRFIVFLASQRTSVAETLATLLLQSDRSARSHFAGQAFRVAFDADGRPSVTTTRA